MVLPEAHRLVGPGLMYCAHRVRPLRHEQFVEGLRGSGRDHRSDWFAGVRDVAVPDLAAQSTSLSSAVSGVAKLVFVFALRSYELATPPMS